MAIKNIFKNRFRTVKRMRYLMGCLISVEVTGEGDRALDGVEAAFGEMKRVEKSLSKFLPESDVSCINRLAGSMPVCLSEEVFDLISQAMDFSKKTEGAFDMTINPLMQLWEMAARRGRVPSYGDIEAARERVGYEKIELDPEARSIRFKKKGMQIDLGGLGKGYAIDRAMHLLGDDEGISDAFIDAGSTLYNLGSKTSRVGVVHPAKNDELIKTVEISRGAISTSADYERFWEIGGCKYGHILDPKTGVPAGTDCASVSVVASRATTTDILSTAFFVMGQAKANRIKDSFEGVESLLMIPAGTESTGTGSGA